MNSKPSVRKFNAHAADVMWAMAGQSARFILQGLSFVLLARLCGAEGLGIVSGSMGLINVLTPFCGWGGANLILKHVARDRGKLPVYLGNSLILLAISCFIIAVVAICIGPPLLGKNFHPILFITLAAAELGLLRLVDIVSLTFMALDRMDLSARVNLYSGILRFLAVILCLIPSSMGTLDQFGWCYMLTSGVGALAAFAMFRTHVRGVRPVASKSVLLRSFTEGFPFSLGIASKSVYSDIDKTMLTSIATAEATGIYSAAYRITSMVFIPAQAVVLAGNARMFRKGAEGIESAAAYGRRLLPFVGGYTAVAGVCIMFAAPLLSIVLGKGFEGSVTVLRWLAWMPLIQGIHYLMGDILMGFGRQGLRSACQLIAGFVNIGLNLLLIPSFSWLGAVIASYASEGLLALLTVSLVLGYLWSEQRKAKKIPAALTVVLRKPSRLDAEKGLVL